MMKEAIDQIRKSSGKFQYESPIGPGFAFDFDPAQQRNPYSTKSPQGPPKMVYEYEEGMSHASANSSSSGRSRIHRTERIVEDLVSRRLERIHVRRELQENNENRGGCTIM